MIFKFLIFFNLVIYIDCFYYNDTTYLESLKNGNTYFQNYYDPLHSESISFLRTLSNSNELNQQCRASLRRWIVGLEDKEIWALKMMEATGKTNGKLTGLNLNFGSFPYCTQLLERDLNENIDFDGKYCLVSLQTQEAEIIKRLPNYQKYHRSLSDRSRHFLEFNIGNAHGVCLPSTCQIEEIALVFNKLFKSLGFKVISPNKCTTASEPEPLQPLQLASFTILFIFIFLSFLSLFMKNDFLSNFSIPHNFNAIYSTDFNENSKEKAYLHAIKTILILASISTHSFIFMGYLWSQPNASIKVHNINYLLKIVMERFIAVASQMFFLTGFFSMYLW